MNKLFKDNLNISTVNPPLFSRPFALPLWGAGYNEKKPELIGVGMNVPYHDQNNV
jgi:hypothetical protein